MKLIRGLRPYFVAILACAVLQTPAVSQNHKLILSRTYHEGETLEYRMEGVNQGWKYTAHAEGVVRKSNTGSFIEEYAWTDLLSNGIPVPLNETSRKFRLVLSLSPENPPAIPNLAQVQPILIGPITDLLTFYSDLWLAIKHRGLDPIGNHIFVRHGEPNSWADGSHTVFGQDAIDFDMTLTVIDKVTKTATLVIKHVPPSTLKLKMPIAWMEKPISGTPNNWAEVQKQSDGSYVAEVGQETFESTIQMSLDDGRILNGSLTNPVQFIRRHCDDAALAHCGEASSDQIMRRVQLISEK